MVETFSLSNGDINVWCGITSQLVMIHSCTLPFGKIHVICRITKYNYERYGPTDVQLIRIEVWLRNSKCY